MSHEIVSHAEVDILARKRRHTRCALVTGVQSCALPISALTGWEPAGAWRAAEFKGRLALIQLCPELYRSTDQQPATAHARDFLPVCQIAQLGDRKSVV